MLIKDHVRRHKRNIFSIFYNIKVFCVFALESPHQGDSTEYTQYIIFNIEQKENRAKLSYICSDRIFPKGLKNEFETAMVNGPSVFEPLKFYCIIIFIVIVVVFILFILCFLASCGDSLIGSLDANQTAKGMFQTIAETSAEGRDPVKLVFITCRSKAAHLPHYCFCVCLPVVCYQELATCTAAQFLTVMFCN